MVPDLGHAAVAGNALRSSRLRCGFHVLARFRSGAAFAILLAVAAACSVAPTLTPTPTPAPTPALAPTADATPEDTQSTGLLIREPESFEGYTLYAREDIYLIDHMGRLIRRWEPPLDEVRLAKLLDNGNLLTSKNLELDPEGNVVWEYSYPQHHDILKLPNGNILFLASLIIPREEAIALGVNPDDFICPNLEATHIIEVRPTGRSGGEVVWQWSAFDHLIQDFDPEKPNYGVVADHPELTDINFADPTKCTAIARDWQHANALDYNVDLDQIMVTARHFSEIWIIDHSTSAEEAAGHTGGNAGKGGDLLYRWGNPRAYQRGTAADQRLFWPHNGHWIPDGLPGAGNVLILNNGNEYDERKRGYSSVEEIALPADGYSYRLDEGAVYGPNEVVWRYTADPPESFYSAGGSGAQRLPNGNTLVTDARSRRIFEVTRAGKTVWEFGHPLPKNLYRAYRYAPDHPGLRGMDLTPYRTAYRAAVAGDPAVRAVFDLYLLDSDLVYVKEACDQDDTETPFFLHVEPERQEDLQQGRRMGFNAIPVDFFLYGALFDGKCAMRVPLPDYPIASVRTGQVGSQGELWSVEFAVGDGAAS